MPDASISAKVFGDCRGPCEEQETIAADSPAQAMMLIAWRRKARLPSLNPFRPEISHADFI